MYISLTWANYALITAVCFVGYYIVVGLVYYRKDLLRLVSSKRKSLLTTGNQQIFSTVTNSHKHPLPVNNAVLNNTESVEIELQSQQPTVEDFMDEIYSYTQACGNDITKEELAISLRRILQKYPSLISSSLWNVLAGVIATACENNCSVQWREDELNELRNG